MDNYDVAVNGIFLASKILDIMPPRFSFSDNKYLSNMHINSLYLPRKNMIVFSEKWLNDINWIEVQACCFHETRHAFQILKINTTHNLFEKINKSTIETWKKEFKNYYQPMNGNDKYLEQEIEIDAISFTHYCMKETLNMKTKIPFKISKEVKMRLRKFSIYDQKIIDLFL